jgi:uncharacterized RDD family membrane protein YckC
MQYSGGMNDTLLTPATPTIYAGFWRRNVAYGIDVSIVCVLYALVSWLLGSVAHAQNVADIQALKDIGWVSQDMDARTLLQQLQTQGAGSTMHSLSEILIEMGLCIVVSAFYNIWFVAGGWQATPGKQWLAMKVVMVDGAPLTLMQSAARHFASGVSIAMLGLGYVTMAFTHEKAALHDLICNTRVVRV